MSREGDLSTRNNNSSLEESCRASQLEKYEREKSRIERKEGFISLSGDEHDMQ